jgi:hypothetical protein
MDISVCVNFLRIICRRKSHNTQYSSVVSKKNCRILYGTFILIYTTNISFVKYFS